MKKLILAMTVALVATTGHAAQRGGLCISISSAIRANTTPLMCPFIGQASIDQIYERGFRVVQVFKLNPKDELSNLGVIIEEQKP